MTDSRIAQYLDWLKTCRRSPRTIDARADILSRIDRDLPHGLCASNADELRGWIFQDRFSDQTIGTYYGAASAFFTWATSQACPSPLDFSPMSIVPPPKVPRGLPRPVSDEQLRRLLTESRQPYQLWALLAAYQGLRCCEIAGLHREHVDGQGLIVVRGKGGKPGMLPTHPQVWAAVRDLPPGPIAWTDKGTRANARWVSIRFALHTRRDLKMPGVGLHRLRHWYGTNLYRATRDIRRTQELMRHSSPTTTAIYTLISDEERRLAVEALPIMTGTQQA